MKKICVEEKKIIFYNILIKVYQNFSWYCWAPSWLRGQKRQHYFSQCTQRVRWWSFMSITVHGIRILQSTKSSVRFESFGARLFTWNGPRRSSTTLWMARYQQFIKSHRSLIKWWSYDSCTVAIFALTVTTKMWKSFIDTIEMWLAANATKFSIQWNASQFDKRFTLIKHNI